ncbi:DUF3035 domain-containing protein [Pseudooceanicola onchidii]|uniref:DUF3035 domain-containing protein n=1 Tax=Pseudooceanicola onchidii TaxID=2562279 RepID=UPI001F10E3EF|nr:DUF3035 domain-containing protein [Pseudooceanicola onchidii]
MPATGRFALPLILLTCTALSACGGLSPDPDKEFALHKVRNTSNGPDEFTVLPTRPLETPPSFVELPQPTPGGANRTDMTPKADAVAALGGRREAVEDRGVGAADGALVTAAARRGIDPNIRADLAETDENFRYRRWLASRLRIFGSDEYYRAYDKQTLDRRETQELWRRAGAPTPSSPPEN